MEVKAPSADIEAFAKSEQVLDYLAAYRQVLVTNQIVATEAELWEAANHPRLWYPFSSWRPRHSIGQIGEHSWASSSSITPCSISTNPS